MLGLTVLGACQQLDPNLAVNVLPATGGTGATGGAGNGTGGAGGAATCTDVRMQVHAILQKDCAICHQTPASMGGFSFILDLDKLTALVSPNSPVGMPNHYVVKGDPAASYIHKRYTPPAPGMMAAMPPATALNRPSPADLVTLDDWISRCIDDPDSPFGWNAPIGPFSPCGISNVCPNGGCCVANQCVPDGMTCGPLNNADTSMLPVKGLPGTCTMGSCQKAGFPCGKPTEPCCGDNTCTGSQSACLSTTNLMTCSQCGGMGEPCCKVNTGCLAGMVCANGKVGFVGTCTACGGLGQECCGTGVFASRTCGTAGLVCTNGTPNTCKTCGGAGQPCCRVAGVDTCDGTLACAPDTLICGAAVDGGVTADASSGG